MREGQEMKEFYSAHGSKQRWLFSPLEPSDDFREFSFYQDCGYGAVEQLSVFGKIRYLFASSISLLSASSLLQS